MSKCWYCNNELTTGDNPKHFGICNKCYDEMFKSGDTIIRSFTNKIAELEDKLAEMTKKYELASCPTGGLVDRVRNLEQQLAEKTLTIEQINKAFIENRSLWKGKYERANQDKISFAIEQLENARKLVDELLDNCGDKQYKVWEVFDNQINGLKEIK